MAVLIIPVMGNEGGSSTDSILGKDQTNPQRSPSQPWCGLWEGALSRPAVLAECWGSELGGGWGGKRQKPRRVDQGKRHFGPGLD